MKTQKVPSLVLPGFSSSWAAHIQTSNFSFPKNSEGHHTVLTPPSHDLNLSFIRQGKKQMKWEVKGEQKESRNRNIELQLNNFLLIIFPCNLIMFMGNILRVKNSFLPFSLERSPALDANPPSASLHHEKAHRPVPHSSTVFLRNFATAESKRVSLLLFCLVYSSFQGKEHQFRVSFTRLGNIIHLGVCLLVCGRISGTAGWS